MDNKLGNKIEVLGLSKTACSELRKCGIDSVQDLMLLINAKLLPGQDSKQGYHIGMREAILNVLKKRPNEILNCEEIREGLISEYGNSVSSNIGSIRSIALSMAYSGVIERASTGQYFYSSNTQINKQEKIQVNNQYYVSLKEAIPEVLRTITGPFDFKIIRDRLKRRYGNRVSTKKSSIKTKLNELLREGTIKRTETGNYIRSSESSNACPINTSTLNRFLEEHIGKEIEFRYKSERSRSDKRWRRETVWMYDDKYLYISKQYLSGRHIIFRKERIVEFREVNNKSK